MTVTITDKNAAAIAYLRTVKLTLVRVHLPAQSITINVLPDTSIGITAGHTDTIDIYKFLVSDALFKMNMNYYSDSANQAKIPLKTTANAAQPLNPSSTLQTPTRGTLF